jgi:hypothetical protein
MRMAALDLGSVFDMCPMTSRCDRCAGLMVCVTVYCELHVERLHPVNMADRVWEAVCACEMERSLDETVATE